MLELNKIYCGDSLELMKQIPDKSIDLVLTDPPYGIGGNKQIGKQKGQKGDKWGNDNWDDKIPDKEYFDEIFRISENQVIWGGNYFGLPPTRCFLIWDKVFRTDFADCEMAWTSFNVSARIFIYHRSKMQGFMFPERSHPTQKPVELMQWCLEKFSKEGDIILDPFLGSGTTTVACQTLHRNFIGIEISPEYCKIANQRLRQKPLL